MSFWVPLEKLPVLCICGHSGAGKTTLLESIIPALRQTGVQPVVVKYNARKIQVDTPGKDSDRLYKSGCDVVLSGDEYFSRFHHAGSPELFFGELCRQYDLVLVEGHIAADVPKIWLHGPGSHHPPDINGILAEFYSEQDTPESIFGWIKTWLEFQVNLSPVWGCVLIGGRSSRMGRPKHLLQSDGVTWLETLVSKLKTRVPQVVIAGDGKLPESLQGIPRIPDVPGLTGPMAGILSVMRWQPSVSWLFVACDLPDMQNEALDWLLDGRGPGVRAVLPSLGCNKRFEPLLAYYNFRARIYLEEAAAEGRWSLGALVGNPGIITPCPPAALHSSWRNVNKPDEI